MAGERQYLSKELLEISSILDLQKRSKLPHIIGKESTIRFISSLLKDISQQSIEILTIWGMAGIGKTHLANYVFQSHYQTFERSCFLEDIERRCTPPNGLLDLQKQLLKDIRVRSWKDIKNLDEGTLKIENALLRNGTLLVLDGINASEQLDVLIGTKGLHPQSKVIITSKNGLLTEKCRLFDKQVPPKHEKLYLTGLYEEESLQLLSWHAFGCNELNTEHDKEKAMKVVQYYQGHPLALKVLGSCLRSEDATWDDILESLGKEIIHGIIEVLRIGFDTLPSEKDRDLFKHIACLFVGEDRKFTEDILKVCGICRSSGIKVLINRCLLSIDNRDQFMMHQLLQDMGRDLVRQESAKEPSKRSVLLHHGECLDVLLNKQATTKIKALALDMRTFETETSKAPGSYDMEKFGSHSSFNWVHILLLSLLWWFFGWVSGMRASYRNTKGEFEILALSEMRNLRILKLNYVQLGGSYKNFPHGLRWLCMHGFPLSYIPSDLQMDNMVALDMTNSKLQQLWKNPKPLGSLKFLNLSSCHELVRVGHFSELPLLERLTLARCTSLVEICESIGTCCQKLEFLDLSECSKLKALPRSIGKLRNLTRLLTSGCSNLCEYPVEMKDMGSLKVLISDNINKSPVFSPSNIMVPRSSKFSVSSLPRSLVELSLKNCNLYNESFPMQFSTLPKLRSLYLDENPIDSMPDCVRSLSSLRQLSFQGCRSLKTVLCTPIQLVVLDILYCDSLEEVTYHPKTSAPPDVLFSPPDVLFSPPNVLLSKYPTMCFLGYIIHNIEKGYYARWPDLTKDIVYN